LHQNHIYQANAENTHLKSTQSAKVDEVEQKVDPALEKAQKLNARKDKIIALDAVYPHLSEEELINSADFVIVGHIKDLVKEYTIHSDIPFSDFSVQVNQFLKAPEGYDLTKNNLIVTQDGNPTATFDSNPLLEKNQKYVLFLRETEDKKLTIVGGPNGIFTFNGDGKTLVQRAKILENQDIEKMKEKLNK
jgi:hypothetical protein